jgi:ABC-type antimicrobial peptide transport system permease subunit
LAGYLKSTFPEIANATIVGTSSFDFKYEEVEHKADILKVDLSFFNMFDVKIIEGSMDFLIPVNPESTENRKIAITRDKALQIFGNESPIGKKLDVPPYYYNFKYYDICAVVTDLPKQSNYPFDFLITIEPDMEWSVSYGNNTLVELVPGIDMEAFKKKVYEHEVKAHTSIKNMTLTPLTSLRYEDPIIERDVQFQHIIIFAIVGLLAILCTLFNYLTLFVSRFRIRQREFALRTVYGASGRSLFAMLSVEFLMSLIVAVILVLVLINILSFSFLKVSGIRLELLAIYFESIIYIASIIVVTLTVFYLTLVIFRHRTLDSSIRSNKKILRKTSIVVQLTVSIVFAFCTIIILKQMYYLHSTTDLGFSFKNRGSVNVPHTQIAALNDKIKQIPEIKETITEYPPLLPVYVRSNDIITDWDGNPGNVKQISIFTEGFSKQYAEFYEFELIEGEFLRDDDNEKYVLINESAAKIFGWDKAVGKSFGDKFNRRVVKGVVKNIYNFSPTLAVEPFYYHRLNKKRSTILFKYDEGSWKTCMEKINKIVEKEFSKLPYFYYSFSNMEEEYDKYLKSENTLLAILTVVSLVCVIVCIFGFVSMVTLTCEERRKEIAIRKINGATVKDILDIFFKEYLTLLAVGALIAFPVGYIIMKRWLEQYVIQTEMSVWVYLLILLALIMIIVMFVGGKVYKTSRENPVNAINK